MHVFGDFTAEEDAIRSALIKIFVDAHSVTFGLIFRLTTLDGREAMKVKSSIRKLCEACRIVKRRGRLYVVCKDNKKVGICHR